MNTTTTRVKTLLGMPAGITFNDAGIDLLVAAANSYVLRKVGQSSLAVQTTVEWPEVYSSGQVEVQLRHTPVVEIAALTNGSALLAAAEYRLDAQNGLIRLKSVIGYWSDARDGVEVMYGWGYTSATTPAELTHAADLVALHWFNKAKNSGKKSESDGGYSYTLDELDIPPAARAVLAAYVDAHIP